MIAVQAALSGALIGGLYALMAAGLSVTWGVLRVINLAHFGLILSAPTSPTRWPPPGGSTRSSRSWSPRRRCSSLGAALQWAYDRLNIVEFNSLLVSFGLLIIVDPGRDATSGPPTSAGSHRPSTRTRPARWTSGGSSCRPPTLLAFAFALVLIGGGAPGAAQHLPGPGHARLRPGPDGRGRLRHRPPPARSAGRRRGGRERRGRRDALRAGQRAHPGDRLRVVRHRVRRGHPRRHRQPARHADRRCRRRRASPVVVSVVWSPAAEPFVLFLAIILALLLRPQGLFRRGGAGMSVRQRTRRYLVGVSAGGRAAGALQLVGRDRRRTHRADHHGAVLDHPGDELEHPVGLQRLLQLRSGAPTSASAPTRWRC